MPCGRTTRARTRLRHQSFIPPYGTALDRLHAASRVVYTGLDPLGANIETRKYHFIHERLEELIGRLRDRIDVFVFSTTLDHLKDVGRAAADVRRLANASAILLVGLRYPKFIAGLVGGDLFGRYFYPGGIGGLAFGAVQLVARIPVIAGRLAARKRQLANSIPLDDLHFHYFTAAILPAALSRYYPAPFEWGHSGPALAIAAVACAGLASLYQLRSVAWSSGALSARLLFLFAISVGLLRLLLRADERAMLLSPSALVKSFR
jgi:hypothetical protein